MDTDDTVAVGLPLAEEDNPNSPLGRFQAFVARLDRMHAAGRISGVERRERIQRYMTKQKISAKTGREAAPLSPRRRKELTDADICGQLIDRLLKEM